MCGFVGFYSPQNDFDIELTLNQMTDAIQYRGPDDAGYWHDELSGISFGHRRLAIQDLSSFGAQPMTSKSGRYVIAFNGEIYNFKEIKTDLEKEGAVFCGHSDTEVMLEAIESKGLVAAVETFVGMFAFSLYDHQDKKLFLVRDRIGEKPLYYGWLSNNFVFGSEIKALELHPSWRGDINRDAIALLLRHNYIPAPHSIYENIYKLKPGFMLTVSFEEQGIKEELTQYWDLANSYQQEPTAFDKRDTENILESHIRASIKNQMISDVPIGAFLSGGIDSSLVVALMQDIATKPVNTFTIGFNEKGFNEAVHAKAVAEHLGTHHHELYVDSAMAMDIIPTLPEVYDEPFADSSQIPTMLLSKLAKSHVTVALSGDGGDELFCGYERYFTTRKAWNDKHQESLFKKMLLDVFSSLPNSISVPLIKNCVSSQKGNSQYLINEKVTNFKKVRASNTLQEFYKQKISYWLEPESIVLGAKEPSYALNSDRLANESLSDLSTLMFLDSLSYLPDDILVKVDRASMAVSLETRVPLLDHRVVEFAAKMPDNDKYNQTVGKTPLRSILYKYVPQKLIDRPKVGFAVPIGQWLRGPLKEWASVLLDKELLSKQGFFNVEQVTSRWNEHITGNHDHSFHLWGIICFQSWLMTKDVR